MMTIEERIAAIEKRNASVAVDKAWETSPVRRIAIALSTYMFMGIFLTVIHVERAWVNALVPVAGFLLSTLTLPIIKHWWVRGLDKVKK